MHVSKEVSSEKSWWCVYPLLSHEFFIKSRSDFYACDLWMDDEDEEQNEWKERTENVMENNREAKYKYISRDVSNVSKGMKEL